MIALFCGWHYCVFCVIWFLYFVSFNFCISTSFAFCIYADKGLWLCFPPSSIPLYQGTQETACHWGLNSQQSLWNTKTTAQIRRYKYNCTNIHIHWPIKICNYHLCRTERDCLSLTSAGGRSFCRVRILDCLVHCQRVSDQLWLEVTKRPIVMAAVMSEYLDKWQQLLQTMSCDENFHSWRQP